MNQYERNYFTKLKYKGFQPFEKIKFAKKAIENERTVNTICESYTKRINELNSELEQLLKKEKSSTFLRNKKIFSGLIEKRVEEIIFAQKCFCVEFEKMTKDGNQTLSEKTKFMEKIENKVYQKTFNTVKCCEYVIKLIEKWLNFQQNQYREITNKCGKSSTVFEKNFGIHCEYLVEYICNVSIKTRSFLDDTFEYESKALRNSIAKDFYCNKEFEKFRLAIDSEFEKIKKDVENKISTEYEKILDQEIKEAEENLKIKQEDKLSKLTKTFKSCLKIVTERIQQTQKSHPKALNKLKEALENTFKVLKRKKGKIDKCKIDTMCAIFEIKVNSNANLNNKGKINFIIKNTDEMTERFVIALMSGVVDNTTRNFLGFNKHTDLITYMSRCINNYFKEHLK